MHARLATPLSLLLVSLLACSDDTVIPADMSVDLPPAVDQALDLAPDLARLDLLPPDMYPGCGDGGAALDLGTSGVTVSGDVLNFFGSPWKIAGAGVSILEQPCRKAVSDSKGAFAFTGLKVGSEVTLLLAHKDYPPQQTGTLTVPAAGAQRFSFQSVNHITYKALAAIAGIKPTPGRCQIATTVTMYGKDVYSSGAHGEAGATVTITPALTTTASAPTSST